MPSGLASSAAGGVGSALGFGGALPPAAAPLLRDAAGSAGGQLFLELRGDGRELLARRIGIGRRVPAEGDGDDREHAVLVAVAVEGLERLDADEGALGQLLAPAEGPLLVGELDEVCGLDEPDVPRLERRPDGLRLGVAVAQLRGGLLEGHGLILRARGPRRALGDVVD